MHARSALLFRRPPRATPPEALRPKSVAGVWSALGSRAELNSRHGTRIARAEARRSVGRHPMGRIPARISVLRPGRRRSCDVSNARAGDVQHFSTNTSFSRHSNTRNCHTVCVCDSIFKMRITQYIPIARRGSQYAYEKKTPVYRRVFLIELIIRR